MLDKQLVEWWVQHAIAYRKVDVEHVDGEKLEMHRQQGRNQNYLHFLNEAVLPAVERLVQALKKAKIMHRVSAWGNHLSLRIHLTYCWGEIVISQDMPSSASFDIQVMRDDAYDEGDSLCDEEHDYLLDDPIPPGVVDLELQFFLMRLVQDLYPQWTPIEEEDDEDDDETDEDDH